MRTLLVSLLLVGCGGPGFSTPIPPADDAAMLVDASANDTAVAVEDASVADAHVADTAVVETVATDSSPGGQCVTPTSPALTMTGGSGGAGIKFHVTKDTTLTSFVFTGAGGQDNLTLSDDSCNEIASASVPAMLSSAYAPYTVNVHWPLKAGVTYQLTNTFQNQTALANATFPYASGILVVDVGLVTCPIPGHYGAVWDAFTDLTFCQ